MNATATQLPPEAAERREPDARGRPHPVPRDPTAPAERPEAAHGDDRSHTPPHGDAVLQPR